jgi:hypothetical protein
MSELSLVYPRFDLGIEFVERALEPAVDSAQTGKRGSGSRSQCGCGIVRVSGD